MNEKEKQMEKTNEAKDLVERIFLQGGNNDKVEDNRDKLTQEWLSEKWIRTKTEYNQSQIYAITSLETLANQWFIKPLKCLINNFRRNQLSKNRGTAKELVNIFKNDDPYQDQNLKRWTEYLK